MHPGMAGGDDLMNLAVTWKNKGAHEFVPAPAHPGPAFMGAGRAMPPPRQRHSYQHQMRSQGSMPGGHYNGGWRNMPPGLGPPRGTTGGMGMGPQHWNQVHGQGGWVPPPVYGPGPGASGMPPHDQSQMMMMQQPRPQAPPPPPTPVLVWKLKAGKTEDVKLEKLHEDLENIDFAPRKIEPLFDYLDGCCLLFYAEDYIANALEVALDGTTDILETVDGQPLRVATAPMWPGVESKFSNPEAASLPPELLQHLAERFRAHRKPSAGMGGGYPMTRGL
eukprot:TRINITY_DN18614_c0_g2_i1.p1 TRINITY_DN18614_c0_g2~~TRINITY_DN18614_c0_g2_i1.p1  ORF type:complete len:277 (-),score=41.46 TRINITY_DN18614_c0_g2_i1:457-1287(-)